jgi:hypothetical protein
LPIVRELFSQRIEARDSGKLESATDYVGSAIADRHGRREVSAKIQAHVIVAVVSFDVSWAKRAPALRNAAVRSGGAKSATYTAAAAPPSSSATIARLRSLNG